MKKLILIFLILFIIPIAYSICCGAGCFPTLNVCACPLDNPTCITSEEIGYIGCFSINEEEETNVHPPWISFNCVECICTSQETCSWQLEDNLCSPGKCNAVFEGEKLVIETSTCTGICGEAETLCNDGSCRIFCDPITCQEDDGCALGCDPVDPDCGSPFCSFLNQEGCGGATCAEGDGCIANCQPFSDPDCQGHFCDFGEDNFCVLGCNPVDPDCSSEACSPFNILACGGATCEPGDACVIGCSPPDLDCGDEGIKDCLEDGTSDCDEGEGCGCEECAGKKDSCAEGMLCSVEEILGTRRCMADSDLDGCMDAIDNCPYIPNNPTGDCAEQPDEDVDGIGDACENIVVCEGTGQCCGQYIDAIGQGNYYGFTIDCLGPEKEKGCWDQCASDQGDGTIIIYEAGPCIDGKRIVTQKLIDQATGELVPSTLENPNPIFIEEPCRGIPLIPFTSLAVILINILVIILFYRFRK